MHRQSPCLVGKKRQRTVPCLVGTVLPAKKRQRTVPCLFDFLQHDPVYYGADPVMMVQFIVRPHVVHISN